MHDMVVYNFFILFNSLMKKIFFSWLQVCLVVTACNLLLLFLSLSFIHDSESRFCESYADSFVLCLMAKEICEVKISE